MRTPMTLLLSSLSWVGLSLAGAALAPTVPAAEATPLDFLLGQTPSTRLGSPPLLLPEWAEYLAYKRVIDQTISMTGDPQTRALAERYGLDIVNITWEDTGRHKGSALGPNISDMTIQVQQFNPATGSYELSLMPVIRYPNFTDLSADLPLDGLRLLVGNEKGEDLQPVPLRDLLGDLRRYLHDGSSWAGNRRSLLAPRDSHVLVSAQAAFLPIPKGGSAQFNPVLFNYQSYPGNPAVLTILATREGTSITVIDNQRDSGLGSSPQSFAAGYSWGQRLFFNQNGERASFTGQRLSDFQAEQATDRDPHSVEVAEEALNMVMLIQVPLKQRQPQRVGFGLPIPAAPQALMSAESDRASRSNVEAAVIGHGEVEGPFTEIDNLEIERDPRFPIRVTVQFYKGTSNGVVSAEDMAQIHEQIARVYQEADYVGSLVIQGDTDRPTEYDRDAETERPFRFPWWPRR
ncbi:hypothetical protein [Thermostichus vulcanus]|uniref:Uncharacterized protein n=1 Tax=Thermostichus vulcanus str. 'Rupite' TaxID=2813851 RepID=A0ABT0CEN3_THEVL|nr:hypothetical protein [Thermostichus vulcanus]MCJ2544248.1 hypothetical protein [Thermostichus vulcanus str. 'Rupite']